MPTMMTLAEAAAALGRDESTLRRQARAGVLGAKRVGRQWLISPAAVERYRVTHLRATPEERGTK